MDYLLQKAFEGAQKYTPAQMAEMLDKHQELIVALAKAFQQLTWWGLFMTVSLLGLIALAIRSEINYRRVRKDLNHVLGRNSDKIDDIDYVLGIEHPGLE